MTRERKQAQSEQIPIPAQLAGHRPRAIPELGRGRVDRVPDRAFSGTLTVGTYVLNSLTGQIGGRNGQSDS